MSIIKLLLFFLLLYNVMKTSKRPLNTDDCCFALGLMLKGEGTNEMSCESIFPMPYLSIIFIAKKTSFFKSKLQNLINNGCIIYITT